MVALFLVLGAGACDVGEVPSGGGMTDAGMGSGTTQAAKFDSVIKPILTPKNCIPCHSGGQMPNFSSYTALQMQYKTGPSATNKLLTEGADGAAHNGVTYFTTAEKVTVGKWIDGTL